MLANCVLDELHFDAFINDGSKELKSAANSDSGRGKTAGKKFEALRKKYDFNTQIDIAKAAGVSRSTIQYIENDAHPMSERTFVKLARILGEAEMDDIRRTYTRENPDRF